jgi:hypothetical protein
MNRPGMVMRWFCWWLAHAGTVFALAAVPAAIAGTWARNEKSLAAVLVAVLVNLLLAASAVQGLRNLWRRSRVAAALLGLVVPLFLVLALFNAGAKADPSALVLFVPALLAVATEALGRRFGWALPEVSAGTAPEPPAPRTPRRSLLRGCLWMIVLGVMGIGGSFWIIGTPVRNAKAFHARLRPGMSLGEVVAAATRHGRYMVFVRQAEGSPAVVISSSSASVGQERAEGADAMRALLERRAGELRVDSVYFTFTGSAPARSTVVVKLGPDGRVESIGDPKTRD